MPDFMPSFSIGVEEEFQIVDAQTRDLKSRVAQVLLLAQAEVGQAAQNELFQSQIETGTPICHSLSDVRAQIVRLRRAVIEAARENGCEIVAAGTHPFASPLDQQFTPKERYFGLADDYAHLTREHFICGCHVHVGIEDREAAIAVLNRSRGWLSCLLALSANSPFWMGEDTGYASYRSEVWRRWPMAGSPQTFGNRAEYDALVRTLVATGSVADETKIYWDIRPADRFETLEFRATDVGLSIDDAVLIAALCRALAQTAWRSWRDDEERQSVAVSPRPELLRAADWRAARFGLEGELVDVYAGESLPASEMIARFVDWLRPALEESGDWDEVSQLVAKVLRDGNGAQRQRAAFEKRGSLEDVVDSLVQQTARDVL